MNKALSAHIHALLGMQSELKIDQLVESSAIFSVGLLFAQSQDPSYTEFMLAQIAAQPFQEQNPYREW